VASEYSSTTSQLFSVASQALGYASLSAGRIGSNSKPALSNPTMGYSVNAKNFGAPPQFSDIFTGADSTSTVIKSLNGQVDEWLEKFFPSINGGLKNVPEDYLINVISGAKPFGTDQSVFDVIWQQYRDQAAKTVRSEQAQLAATFSSRGFSIPPGALIDQMARAESRGTDAVSISSQLKMGILTASADYFRAFYSVHNLSNETARIRAQAYQSFYGALSNYYNVEVNWENLRLQAAVEKANTALGVDRNKVGLYGGGDGVAGAHAQASRGFSDIASAANAAAGTLVAQIEAV
jgi:hypothetical protein